LAIAEKDPQLAETQLINWIKKVRKEKETDPSIPGKKLSAGSIRLSIVACESFLRANRRDQNIKWGEVQKAIPRPGRRKDESPPLSAIQKLLGTCDSNREKFVVCLITRLRFRRTLE
jgi:hypothetical protein